MDQQKIDKLASDLFKLLLGDEHNEAEAMSAGIQALCMVAAFHSKSFADLQHKMSLASRFGAEYIDANREAYEAAMKESGYDA